MSRKDVITLFVISDFLCCIALMTALHESAARIENTDNVASILFIPILMILWVGITAFLSTVLILHSRGCETAHWGEHLKYHAGESVYVQLLRTVGWLAVALCLLLLFGSLLSGAFMGSVFWGCSVAQVLFGLCLGCADKQANKGESDDL